jgi:histidine phosphotransferase ChpT
MVSSGRDAKTGKHALGEGAPRDEASPDEAQRDRGRTAAVAPPPAIARDGLRLAALLAARLCHEVGGPVGTLAGAIEIARSEPASAAEALDIATLAAGGLAARVRLLRAAWAGAAEETDVGGLRALCAGLPRQVHVDFDGLPDAHSFSAAAVDMLLNVLLLAAESLPKGGVVIVGEAGPETVMVVPQGQNAAWPPGLAAWMADPLTAWRAVANATPRRLQGPLTALMAHAAGARLSFALAAGAEAAPPLMVRFP